MTTTLQLFTRDNGAGLTRDLALLEQTLSDAGFPVIQQPLEHQSALRFGVAKWRHRWRRLRPQQAPASDRVNMMLERVHPEHLDSAAPNVLVPNPEWTRDRWRPWLPAFDRILAKTRHAVPLYEKLGCRVTYTGFTSADRMDSDVPRQGDFLHVPGRSGNKGTARLLALWQAHPEWPELTVVWRRKNIQPPEAENIRIIREHLDDSALKQLQNQHRFHLCPSRTEGYGHYLVEAMSVGAVVITCDAPPMNELVTGARGLPVTAHGNGSQALATLYDFDSEAMEAAIEQCLAMSQRQVRALGANARRWFENNQVAFGQRLTQALTELTDRRPQAGPPHGR